MFTRISLEKGWVQFVILDEQNKAPGQWLMPCMLLLMLRQHKNGVDIVKVTISTPFYNDFDLKDVENAAENTKHLQAEVGRASYTSKSAQNMPDPGAKAVAIWIRAAYEVTIKSQ